MNLAIWSILTAEVAGSIPDCDYFDTVDLTHSHRFDNGSYLYEGLLISKEQVGNYSKLHLFDSEDLDVPEHPRGCVCRDKPCIRFCCELDDYGKRICKNTENGEQFVSSVKITLDNGNDEETDLKDFTILRHITCKGFSHLEKEWSSSQKWKLFKV